MCEILKIILKFLDLSSKIIVHNINETIEINNLKKGLYFLKLVNKKTIKFIKKTSKISGYIEETVGQIQIRKKLMKSLLRRF